MRTSEQDQDLTEIIEWDIPNWSVALRYWSKHTSYKFSSISALEIGSRHGGLSLWAALNGATVLCTDLQGPSYLAIAKHKRFNVSHSIKYEALSTLDIPYSGRFDVVFFKSVLGGVGRSEGLTNQARAINEIHKSLTKGGELWFAENLSASPIHQYFREKYVRWSADWRYMTIQEMNSLLSVFSEVSYVTAGFLGTFGQNSRQRSILGRLDRIGVDRLVAETWRYIMIGIAKK